MKLQKVRIKNFKSIRDQTIEMSSPHLTLGKNASGKTNLLEFFKFIKIALTDTSMPYNPVADWWGYKNVVYERDINKNIEGTFVFFQENENNSFKIEYTVNLGQDQFGDMSIKRELIEVKDILRIDRSMNSIIFELEESYKNNMIKKVKNEAEIFDKPHFDVKKDEIIKDLKNPHQIKIKTEQQNQPIFNFLGSHRSSQIWENYRLHIFEPRNQNELNKKFITILPIFMNYKPKQAFLGNINDLLRSLFGYFNRITLIRHPDLRAIREPAFPKKFNNLEEDGGNLVEILYRLWMKNKSLPKDMLDDFKLIFPNTSINFDLTADGRILLTIKENNLELHPHSISDGFYKIIFILTAIHRNPSLLLIDEIENSLYKEAIEVIFDRISYSNVTTIASTHSPILIDMVDLEHLLIVESKGGESKIHRPKDVKMLKSKISDLGLGHSDAWFAGALNA